MAKQYVSYVRVSTKIQHASGLGLEAQMAAVATFIDSNGGTVIATYQETESGTKSDRPALARALAHAKRAKAILLVAKLDRLARNVHFVSGLMESGVDFTACDLSDANRLTIHILAAVAENEAKAISDRTKAGLAALKARGIALGSHREGSYRFTAAQSAKGSLASANAQRSKAIAAYNDLIAPVRDMRTKGLSLREIANRLNDEGHKTVGGSPWTAMAVSRMMSRIAA